MGLVPPSPPSSSDHSSRSCSLLLGSVVSRSRAPGLPGPPGSGHWYLPASQQQQHCQGSPRGPPPVRSGGGRGSPNAAQGCKTRLWVGSFFFTAASVGLQKKGWYPGRCRNPLFCLPKLEAGATFKAKDKMPFGVFLFSLKMQGGKKKTRPCKKLEAARQLATG